LRRKAANQGCQIFSGATYQNGEKCTKWPQNTYSYVMAIKFIKCPKRPNVHKIGMPTSSITRPFRIYPNLEFLFETIPSGNPAANGRCHLPWVDVNRELRICDGLLFLDSGLFRFCMYTSFVKFFVLFCIFFDGCSCWIDPTRTFTCCNFGQFLQTHLFILLPKLV
jgi:hypothetical protein